MIFSLLSLVMAAGFAEPPKPTNFQIFDVQTRCTSLGQVCTPVIEKDIFIPIRGYVHFTFHVPKTACSGLEVRYALNEGDWSAWSEKMGWYQPTAVGKLVSDPMPGGPVVRGHHHLHIQARGRLGGCNQGQLQAWGGQIQIDVQ